MNRTTILACKFVNSIPEKLAERTLYVSMDYATVAHNCCCGCGKEVVTPLSPTDWKLIYDGVSISLTPSIGNWSFECKSHYWIEKGNVSWASQWSREQIEAGRAQDRRAKGISYPVGEAKSAEGLPKSKRHPGFFSRLLKRFSR